MVRVLVIGFTALAVCVPQLASAYLVANAVTLKELFEEHSEVVFKGTVISSEPVEEDSLKKRSGYRAFETVFRLISVVKGDIQGAEIRFRHYSNVKDDQLMRYSPQSYSFDVNSTYIVCANKTKTPDVLRQIWDAHRSKHDQGVLRAADEKPHQGKTLAEVYQHELTGLLQSDSPQNAIYAINQLNAMTGVGHSSHKSLDRASAVDAIISLAHSKSDEVAVKAIQSMNAGASHSGDSVWRLFALNPAHFPGFSIPPKATPNQAAKKHRKTLIDIAQSNASIDRRSAAIISLGQSMDPMLVPTLEELIADKSPGVRAAAVIVLAEYADNVAADLWAKLLLDESVEVRRSAIRAIGIGQVSEHILELDQLLDDQDPSIVTGAAASLLSFPLEKSQAILKSRIGHEQYGCLFINALAIENTAAYVDELGEIVRTNPRPVGWWGGRMTWGVSWDLLFKYVQAQPPARVRAGDFDAELASLESPITEREQSNHFSSSEPRDLYALYVQRGMQERARTYRREVVEKTRYDMDQYLDKVDRRPNDFQR